MSRLLAFKRGVLDPKPHYEPPPPSPRKRMRKSSPWGLIAMSLLLSPVFPLLLLVAVFVLVYDHD